MKIVIVSWVVLASLAAFGTTPQTGTPQTGVIKGTVVDAAGNPVAAAQVSTSVDLDSKDIIVWSGPIPTFQTDANGHFLVTNLVVGHHYKVYAMKEEAGYPNMMVGLFNPRICAGRNPPSMARLARFQTRPSNKLGRSWGR